LIAHNLKYLRTQVKKETQDKIAKSLSISRSSWVDYESGRASPKADVLIKIADYFQVSIDDLLKVDLKTKPNVRLIPIENIDEIKQNIDFIPVKAKAGYSQGVGDETYIKDLFRFTLPKLPKGNYRAFEIEGDSMLPLQDGFIIIGKFIDNFQKIKSNHRHVVILKEEGIVFKKVVNEVSKNQHLLLVSDNTNYLPYSVNINEVLEVWEMVAFIGFPDKNASTQDVILEKLEVIDQKLNSLSHIDKTSFNS